jgi:7-carboxy-7-deazaguanine synthase (Cx14CxxC type)
MPYAVKEIYYTLQGEGAHTGRAAVFLRFSGCNLWTGLERDRQKGPGGCSAWCDTDFVGTDGPGGGKFQEADELVEAVLARWPSRILPSHRAFVVCTGGEPLLQLNAELLAAFEIKKVDVAVETNGTQELPPGKLWVTVSPKANAPLRVTRGHELKLVYPQDSMEPERFQHLDFSHFFLQPMDGPSKGKNTESALQYCLSHPQWRLSIQTHKLLGIP